MSDTVILKVHYLGGFKLAYQDSQQSRPIALSTPPTIKSQSLLAFLIFYRDQEHRRDRLVDMFWGDTSPSKARRSLSTALWHIRKCFPDQNTIQGNSQTLQFTFLGEIELDIEKFKKKAKQRTSSDLQDATILYKGDFLDAFYDDWVISERYRLQSLFIETLAKLMSLHERAGDFNNALHIAQELLKFDSLREDAHRLLMRTYCALGQRNAALEQYRSCQKVLKDELDIDPTPETSGLFQDIQSGNYKIGKNTPTVAAASIIRITPTVRSPLDVASRQVLVGREDELSSLDEQWAGQCNLVLVTGEAGIGKTHLLETFAKNLSTQGVRVLWGRCYEFEHLLPYQPIAEALRPSLTKLTTEAMSRLPEWVIGELGRLIPEALAGRPKHNERSSTSTDQEQMLLFAGVNHYLSVLSDSTRVLLVLEDLHWAAESTLELLHYLARHTPTSNAPLLIVGSYRPESLERQHPLRAFQRQLQRDGMALPFQLLPLSDVAVEQFLYEMSGRDKAIIPLTRRLNRETEGNPFFLVEIIKALFEMNTITLKEGAWQGDFDRISRGELPLPASIKEVIQARVHRMGETTQDALRTAAILGREFDFDLLVATWTQNEDITLDALDEMLRYQVIDEGTGISNRDYAFRHHKIQEVIHSMIPRQRRQYIHAQVAIAMEKHFSPQDETVSELAHHYLQAQNLDRSLAGKAAHYLLQAGNLAAKQFANVDAVTYYNRGLTVVPDTDQAGRYALLSAREHVYYAQGNRDAQQDDLVALWELVQDMTTEEQAEVMLRQARLARETSDYDVAMDAAQSVINLAKANQQLLASEGFMIWGNALNRQGKFKEAQSRFKQGLNLARTAGASWLEAYCLNGLGLSFHYLGITAKARHNLEEAAQIYRQIEDLRGLSAALNNLGVIANEQGDNIAAKSFYEDALDIHKKMGNPKGEGLVLGNLGVIAAAQGEYIQAKKDHQQALAIARKIKHRLFEGNALLNLGNVYLSLGAYEKASECYDQALDVYRQIGNRTGEGWGLAYASLHAHHLGDHQLALTFAQEALCIAEEIGDRHIQGYAWTHLGHALLALERSDDAYEAYQKAVGLRRELKEMHLAMESLSGILRVCLDQSHLAKATLHLEEMLSFLEKNSLEGVDEPLRIYLTCFQALCANGDTHARQMLISAHTLIEERAAKIGDEALRHSFQENIPAHREIAVAFAKDKTAN